MLNQQWIYICQINCFWTTNIQTKIHCNVKCRIRNHTWECSVWCTSTHVPNVIDKELYHLFQRYLFPNLLYKRFTTCVMNQTEEAYLFTSLSSFLLVIMFPVPNYFILFILYVFQHSYLLSHSFWYVNTTCVTSVAGTAYTAASSGALEFTPGFGVANSLVFCELFYRWWFVHLLVFFEHCIVCFSSNYGFWLPLWYLQLFGMLPLFC